MLRNCGRSRADAWRIRVLLPTKFLWFGADSTSGDLGDDTRPAQLH